MLTGQHKFATEELGFLASWEKLGAGYYSSLASWDFYKLRNFYKKKYPILI